jgi:hypothetical protein
MIEALEDGLVALLGSALPDIKVEPFPDDPDKYRLTHPHGAVLVGYGGGRFGKPYTLAGTAQEQRVEYQLVIKVRRLRSHVGAYGVLRAIRVALSNRKRPGGQVLPDPGTVRGCVFWRVDLPGRVCGGRALGFTGAVSRRRGPGPGRRSNRRHRRLRPRTHHRGETIVNQLYRYSGPISAVTLPDASLPKGRQVRFFPGGEVTLPDDNAYVRSLVARGYLTPVTAPAAQVRQSADSTAPGVAQSGPKQPPLRLRRQSPRPPNGKAAATAGPAADTTKGE